MITHRWVTCPTCDGDGGPPSLWDDDRHRWVHYVCRSCSGTGGRNEPVDLEEDEQ